MAFSNDVVGGTTLLRPAIRSPNYVAGVSGWTINRDGTSEFAGGTFRGPVVVIDPSTGIVLASIGADGNISAQNFYATGDVIIGTLSVLSAITAAGRGVVSRLSVTTGLPSVPINSVFATICSIGWNVDHTRQYVLHSDAAYVQQTNSLNSENFTFQMIVAQSGGLNATVFNETFAVKPCAFKLPTESFMLPTFSADGPATISLRGTNDASTGSAYPIETDTGNGWNLWIEDAGPRIAATPGTAITTKYFATVSDTFSGLGSGARENDPNNMYTGQLSGRTNGAHENAMWVFPGSTIRSDLTGKTIISAKLWMYCTNASGASGGCFLSYVANTSIPATEPSTGTDSGNHQSVWPVPGWGSIDITSALTTSIISGSKNAIYLQDSTLTGSASFYGAGNATFKPYLEINYM